MNSSLVKAHRLLAILLGAFIVSHLTIHITAISGPEVHTSALKKVQPIYRNWIIEPLLMLAIVSQIIIGAKLLRRRWKHSEKGFWGWAQLMSGLYIAFFLLVHTSAAMFTRYVGGLDTNFYWAAATLNIDPLQYLFTPYYFLGVTSIFVHLAAAVKFGWKKSGSLIPVFIIIFGSIVATIIISAFNGSFFDITIPEDYIKLFNFSGA